VCADATIGVGIGFCLVCQAQYPWTRMGEKRAKRRRRERKRTKRQQQPPVLVPAGGSGAVRSKPEPIPTYQVVPKVQPEDESLGDALAIETRNEPDEPEGGAAAREPRRPKPNAPLAGAASAELPRDESDVTQHHEVILPPE
jgi:hypothetical protein